MPERGRLVLAACGQCRRSKIKCDGERPVCGSCRHRQTRCVYSTQPGETRTGALRSENERLRATNGSLVEFLWKIKYSTPSQAQALIENFDSVESLLSGTHEENLRHAAPHDSETTLRRNYSTDENSDHLPGSTSQSPSRAPRERPSSAPDATIGRASLHNIGLERIDSSMNLVFSDREVSGTREVSDTQGLSASGLSSSKSGALQLSLQSNASSIRSGFVIKQACISEIFVCHSNEEFESLFAEFDRPQERPISADAICEMCAVAATCGQYARDLLHADLLDYWYDSAKVYFDECIQTSPFKAIKVSALFGLYNLLNKSTVSLAYFDFGLSLSSRLLEQWKNQESALSLTEVQQVNHMRRSMTFCNGWLQATLGFVSSIEHSDNVSIAETTPSSNERDFVQDIVTSVAILKAKTLRVLWNCSSALDLLDSIQPLEENLRTWYGRLPHAAQLKQLSTGSYMPLKTSIYYAHLLHMGATMLIFRRCLAMLRDPTDRQELPEEQQNSLEITLHDGIKAAQHTARILFLVREASQSVRHCWITMWVLAPYQSYVSGMILCYYGSRLRLSGIQQGSDEILDLADQVLQVLAFCAELDPVARNFERILSTHQSILRGSPGQASSTAPVTSVGSQASRKRASADPVLRELLLEDLTGNTKLHQTSIQVLEHLSNPYADTGDRPSQSMGHQLRTPLESLKFRGLEFPKKSQPLTASMLNQEDGYFVDSHQPSGWLPQRSSQTYVQNAKKLGVLE